jgi:hypothetical protein
LKRLQREVDGKLVADYKLSRFACYLAAMNGDPKKPQVAQAQSYFVAWAEACRLFLEESDGVERVAIRGEGIRGQPALERTAENVGGTVRRTMIEISGKLPENLPPAEDIKQVHKKPKSSHREIKKLDKPKN